MENKKTKKLVKEERTLLHRMIGLTRQGTHSYSMRAIARELGRSPSTILRELKRNAAAVDKHADCYTRATQAQAASHERRSAASKRKMRLKNETIRHYVELHLREALWSPETIAGKLTLLGYAISYEAIYQWVNEERPDLKQYLLVSGKAQRRRRSGKRHRRLKQPAAPKRSIELLPEAAKARASIGHLELDAIVGRRGGAVIQSKIDRHSRKLFLDKALGLNSDDYADILIARMKRDVPLGVLQTILQDNGAEHAAHSRVDAELNVQSFFCHPYCASERGSVETSHRGPRRFLPKGSDFDGIPEDFIEWLEDQHNNRPMKVLGFKTPNQVWAEGLAQRVA